MTTDSTLTRTHVSQLRKVRSALMTNSKLNAKSTKLVLSQENQFSMNEAAVLISRAINILNNIK